MRVTHFLICFLLSTLALAASAFERPFPPAAKRGTMLHSNNFVVNHTENGQGEIVRIWLLAADQAHQPAPASLPIY
jgi:hypothetical protein